MPAPADPPETTLAEVLPCPTCDHVCPPPLGPRRPVASGTDETVTERDVVTHPVLSPFLRAVQHFTDMQHKGGAADQERARLVVVSTGAAVIAALAAAAGQRTRAEPAEEDAERWRALVAHVEGGGDFLMTAHHPNYGIEVSLVHPRDPDGEMPHGGSHTGLSAAFDAALAARAALVQGEVRVDG